MYQKANAACLLELLQARSCPSADTDTILLHNHVKLYLPTRYSASSWNCCRPWTEGTANTCPFLKRRLDSVIWVTTNEAKNFETFKAR
jgi:hypothetical protein